MTVLLLAFCIGLVASNPNNRKQITDGYNGEINNNNKFKTYKLEVPGKESITVVETASESDLGRRWKSPDETRDKDVEIKNLMTHIIHDFNSNRPRCYGPSCQDDYNGNDSQQESLEIMPMTENLDKLRDYRDFNKNRLQAISDLATKLKNNKFKTDRFSSMNGESTEDDNSGKVYTSWNQLKVKQHKHPYDDKDGWVTLEPVAWSVSKISKWKPNVKKQKPSHLNEEDESFPSDDRFTSSLDMDTGYNYPHSRPQLNRPGYINNKLHLPSDYGSELPSKPLWARPPPSQPTFQSSWAPDESRRPHKHNCDYNENYPHEDPAYYEMQDPVMIDSRPTKYPYDYEALHQSVPKRPFRRPAMYAGMPDIDEDDRSSRPTHGDGQWVLLSTTKGYRNKKRQRSLSPMNTEESEYPSVTSHQTVGLTVLPVDDKHTNMTTSHGGLLEVERSFQTVEESKLDMDKRNDLEASASQPKPVRNKVFKKKFLASNSPDSSTVFAAVGAGMLPATMAMVVPMMLGRRRRRDLGESTKSFQTDDYIRYLRNE